MARLLKITYAGVVLGKDQIEASYNLAGKYVIDESYERFAITFDVHIENAVRATFLAAEAALRAAFKKPDQALTVELGATSRHAFDPATNTGFLTRATCRKIGGRRDTANAATYRCAVVVRLPADLTGRAGRRDGKVIVDETPAGRRRVTIAGDYTALSTNSARAQYTAALAAWQAVVLADLGGGSWDQTTNAYNYDEQNKELTFSRVLEEIILNQGLGTTDVASLRSPHLIVRRQTRQLDGVPGLNVRPLVGMVVQYDTWVDKAVTTDLPGLYASTIRPLILSEVNSISRSGSSAVVREEPSYDRTDNRISVTMDLQVDAGGQFYQARVVVSDRIRHGLVLVPVWSDDVYARDSYQGPASHVKVYRRTTIGKPGAARGRIGVPPTISGFVEIEQMRDEDRFDLGIVGDTLPLEAVVHTYVFERANLGAAAEGGGGGGSSSGRGGEPVQLGFVT